MRSSASETVREETMDRLAAATAFNTAPEAVVDGDAAHPDPDGDPCAHPKDITAMTPSEA
jgi:hypothetical protein